MPVIADIIHREWASEREGDPHETNTSVCVLQEPCIRVSSKSQRIFQHDESILSLLALMITFKMLADSARPYRCCYRKPLNSAICRRVYPVNMLYPPTIRWDNCQKHPPSLRVLSWMSRCFREQRLSVKHASSFPQTPADHEQANPGHQCPPPIPHSWTRSAGPLPRRGPGFEEKLL